VGMAVAQVAAQAQPALLLVLRRQVGAEAQAHRGHVHGGVATPARQRRGAAALAEAVGADFDAGVLQVRLDADGTGIEAVAQVGEQLAGVGVVTAGQRVAEAAVAGLAVDFHPVPALAVAGGQAERTPRVADVDAGVAVAGLAAGTTLAHVEVAVAGAAEDANAPAAEHVVDTDQDRVAVVADLGGVAVTTEVTALVLDLDPGAGRTLGLAAERAAAGGTIQGRVADQAAAFQQDLAGAGVDFAA